MGRRVCGVLIAATDTVPWLTGLLLGLAMIAIAVTIIVVNNGAATGRIGPNPGFGIRTSATRSSKEAWRAAHQAAGPIMQFAAMVSLMTGIVVLFLRSSPNLFWGMLLVGAALLAILSIFGAVIADRAAKRVGDA